MQTFYRRPLPAGLVPFASAEGRQVFQEALAAGDLSGWFPLAQHFHTQADPAFCGLGTLVVVLNALEIDPGRLWKGPWRWFGEELLDCCKPLDQVRAQGLSLSELACLARCNGASARVAYAADHTQGDLRAALLASARAPNGPFVVVNYDRRTLGQTGAGHFSPVAGVHVERDLALVLDVARFKYPPHWVPIPQLWEALAAIDPDTDRSRGWVVLDRSPVPIGLAFRLAADPSRWRSLAAHLAALDPVDLEDLRRRVPPDLITLPQTADPEHQRRYEDLTWKIQQTVLFRRLGPGSEALAVALWVLGDRWPALGPDLGLGELDDALRGEVEALREQVTALQCAV